MHIVSDSKQPCFTPISTLNHSGARVRGCAGARVRGCAGARVRGCAGARVRGCAGARVRGCAGARVRGCAGARERVRVCGARAFVLGCVPGCVQTEWFKVEIGVFCQEILL